MSEDHLFNMFKDGAENNKHDYDNRITQHHYQSILIQKGGRKHQNNQITYISEATPSITDILQ